MNTEERICLANKLYDDNRKDKSFREVFNTYKNGAKKRKYEFKLSIDQFKNLIYSNCHYCGVAPFKSFRYKSRFYHIEYPVCIYNGIDRMDNSLGYTIENSLPCCSVCNIAKRDIHYNEFIKYIKRLVDFNNHEPARLF